MSRDDQLNAGVSAGRLPLDRERLLLSSLSWLSGLARRSTDRGLLFSVDIGDYEHSSSPFEQRLDSGIPEYTGVVANSSA